MNQCDFYEEDELAQDVKAAFDRRCHECKQRQGRHKMDCSIGRAFPCTPAPGDWVGNCCGHPLTLKGELNTSYHWECSERCECLISGCVPNYDR